MGVETSRSFEAEGLTRVLYGAMFEALQYTFSVQTGSKFLRTNLNFFWIDCSIHSDFVLFAKKEEIYNTKTFFRIIWLLEEQISKTTVTVAPMRASPPSGTDHASCEQEVQKWNPRHPDIRGTFSENISKLSVIVSKFLKF